MIAHREINEASTSSPSAASIYTLAALALPRVLERAAARRSRASAIGSIGTLSLGGHLARHPSLIV